MMVYMEQVWISAAGLSLATMLGAVIGFIVKELPHKWNDIFLGFCAGIMLTALNMLSLRKARIFSTTRISLRCKRFFNRGARPKSASSVNSILPGALQETDYTLKFRLFGQAAGAD